MPDPESIPRKRIIDSGWLQDWLDDWDGRPDGQIVTIGGSVVAFREMVTLALAADGYREALEEVSNIARNAWTSPATVQWAFEEIGKRAAGAIGGKPE